MHLNNKTSILLVIFTLFVTSILAYLVFGKWTRNFVRANEIIARASPQGVAYYYFHCVEEEPGSDINKIIACQHLAEYYDKRAKDEWSPLIKKYQDIACSDFPYRNDATDFYEYFGGGTYNAIIKASRDGYRNENGQPYSMKLYFNGTETGAFNISAIENHYYYDPYHLDTNKDGIACEVLPEKPLPERSERAIIK